MFNKIKKDLFLLLFKTNMDENDEPIQASNNKFYKIYVDNNFKKEIISIKCKSKEYGNIIPPKKYSTIDYTIDDLKKLNKIFYWYRYNKRCI